MLCARRNQPVEQAKLSKGKSELTARYQETETVLEVRRHSGVLGRVRTSFHWEMQMCSAAHHLLRWPKPQRHESFHWCVCDTRGQRPVAATLVT